MVSAALAPALHGRARYADVEAVRVCRSGLRGPGALLTEAYERLGVPLAITEAHLAGSAEERARWLSYVWTSAESARASGVPVQAVTAWALFGSYGWDRLVTEGASSYEAGAFETCSSLRWAGTFSGPTSANGTRTNSAWPPA